MCSGLEDLRSMGFRLHTGGRGWLECYLVGIWGCRVLLFGL